MNTWFSWTYLQLHDVAYFHCSYDEELAQADAREQEVKSRTKQQRFKGHHEGVRKPPTWK